MKIKALLLTAAVLASTAAQATIFNVKWSGAQFDNGATAVGQFDINTAVYPDLGGAQNFNTPGADFTILSVTITGASSGNGTFTQSDFSNFYFAAFNPLNYAVELIGQPLGNGFNFGSFGAGYGGPSGDFNLFASTLGAPSGSFYFVLTTDNGSGDSLAVTSISAAVPEPASWALMVAGFGLVGFAARRRSVTVAA